MNPNVGSVVAEGIAQITTAAIRQNAMRPDEVIDFMRKVGEEMNRCVKDVSEGSAHAALTVQDAETVQAQPSPVEAVAPTEAVSEQPAPVTPQVVASDDADHEVEEAEETTVAQEEQAADPADPESPNYKFKHLSRKPIVPVEESVQRDYIVILFDGQRKQMIKRPLRSQYNMSPEEYIRHFDLPEDYPLVAPGYSEEKRKWALQTGFGKGNTRTRATPAKSKAKVTRRKRAAAAS